MTQKKQISTDGFEPSKEKTTNVDSTDELLLLIAFALFRMIPEKIR